MTEADSNREPADLFVDLLNRMCASQAKVTKLVLEPAESIDIVRLNSELRELTKVRIDIISMFKRIDSAVDD